MGTYTATANSGSNVATLNVPNCVIRGVDANWASPDTSVLGTNRPTLNANGFASGSKAIINLGTAAANTRIENLNLSNCATYPQGNPTNNYAAIRINNRMDPGYVAVRYCQLDHNDNGILGYCDSILVEYCNIHDNGSGHHAGGLGDGQQHNIYVDGSQGAFCIRYSWSHHSLNGHLVKSRAVRNWIYYNRITDDADTVSRNIDLPDCGRSFIIGNVITQEGSSGDSNGEMIGYGAENQNNPTKECYVFHNTFVNTVTTHNAYATAFYSGTTAAQLKDNIFYGDGTFNQYDAAPTRVAPDTSNNFYENDTLNSAKFLNPATGDYHLTAATPGTIVNAGVALGTVASTNCTPDKQYVYDLSNQARTISGSAIDIGAFEFTAAGGSGGNAGCPFVLTETGSGFSVENSILGRSEDGGRGRFVSDAYPLLARADARGRIRLRVAELETETDEIDELRLGRVEVPAGDRLATDSSGRPVLMHQLEIPIRTTQWSGRQLPFQSPVAPSKAFRGEAGDSAEFELQPGQSVAINSRLGVAVQLRAKQPAPSLRASPQGGATGITIRVSPDGEGERWITLGSVIPREFWSTDILPSTGPAAQDVRRIRVIWHTPHTLGWIGVVETAEVQPQILPCLMARHSAGGSVLGELNARDGRIATIRPEEFVELEFDAGEASTGTQYVLLANGRYYRTATQKSIAMPAAYGLAQNRPNPFNPETSIEFDLPSPSSVTLRVYSVAGLLIRTIIDKEMPAGYHMAHWNARDDRGTPLPSGVYFYELRAGAFEEKRRMVLLR